MHQLLALFLPHMHSTSWLGAWESRGCAQRTKPICRRAGRVPPLIRATNDLEDLKHLIGAQRWPEAALAVNQLAMDRYEEWTANDWLELGHLLERARPAHEALDRRIRLEIAHQFVQRQDLQIARVWLDDIVCESAVDAARRAVLLSEVFKADPAPESRDAMWTHLRQAIDLCRSVIGDPVDGKQAAGDLRHYEQSLARLRLYFGHEATAARSEFERLRRDLEPATEQDRSAAEAYVAASRNLAECLFEFEPFSADPSLKPTAHEILDKALRLAERHDLASVAAEIAYSQAKLAEAQSHLDNALTRLDACKTLALRGAHFVCYRIADMRRYWLNVRFKSEAFDYAAFRARQSPLDFLSWHAWAARYAGQSRLWAAYRLCKDGKDGDAARAAALLRRNLEAFESRPDLATSSDRRFVALSRAGLAVVEGGEEGARIWGAFLNLEWSGAWLEQSPSREPKAIWASCS